MSRKNIFEIVSETFDLSKELSRMKDLFEKKTIVRMPYSRHYSILEYVRQEGFSHWRNRGHCVDVDDYLALLNYQELWETAANNKQDFFTLVEIIYNFWHITNRTTDTRYVRDECSRNFQLLKTIMDDCLSRYNYKGKYFSNVEQLIVMENNPGATAVAEIVTPQIGREVLRYNHHLMQGDLKEKKGILLALGSELEPKRKQLKAVNSSLEDGIFFILNNLNLRHNNTVAGAKNYNKFAAEMDEETTEFWYDELYQMMLLAYLEMDQAERNEKVSVLKTMVNSN